MPMITVSGTEQQLLIELLDSQSKELLHEIHHTDDRDYKQSLKDKEGVMAELLKRLKAASS
ncbi:MAG: hypothetical protein AB7P69_04605 [Candidatus Binatia bacterium]